MQTSLKRSVAVALLLFVGSRTFAQQLTADLDGTNLNLYTTPGWYLQADGNPVNIGSNLNYPERTSGILLVSGDIGSSVDWIQGKRVQTFFTADGAVYVRSCYPGAVTMVPNWTAWAKQASTAFVDAEIRSTPLVEGNIDLDSYQTSGRFIQWDYNGIGDGLHYPLKTNGLLTVSTSNAPAGTVQYTVVQTYQTLGGILYMRSYGGNGGNGWTQWVMAGSSQWSTLGTTGISYNGSVGIGTNSTNDPAYRLFVETGIRTRKLKVDQAEWPDYVFDTAAYKLAPLGDVAGFIGRNGHLPGLPSAAEVKRDGVDIGDNQASLLRKIEELTLYAISQDKKQAAQEKAIAGQTRLLLQMQKKIDDMEKRSKQHK